MTKDSGQQPGDLRGALCTEPHFWRPEGVVTDKQAGVCGKPSGTAQGVCAHTPFHSPAFMPRTHHGQVALWICSAALLEHLLYTTAHLNHSHSQPHAHHSPQTNPTHTVFSPSHLITPTHPHRHTTQEQSLALPQVTRPAETPYSGRLAPSQRAIALVYPLPVAQSASRAIRTDITHPTGSHGLSFPSHTSRQGYTYPHSNPRKRWG